MCQGTDTGKKHGHKTKQALVKWGNAVSRTVLIQRAVDTHLGRFSVWEGMLSKNNNVKSFRFKMVPG